MELYSIYKIDSHFKLFYNFKTLAFDNRENSLNSEHFNTSRISCRKICKDINAKETLKNYGAQHYSFIKETPINNLKK